jgi:hypothetical protein
MMTLAKGVTVLILAFVIAGLVVFAVPMIVVSHSTTCNPSNSTCNISGTVTCYETLGYHFLGFGWEKC